ncbi:hypothetical protein D9M69_718360 [compost metagenome]
MAERWKRSHSRLIDSMVNRPAASKGASSIHGVMKMPSALGMVAWIIIAPEILASASRSLPCRTQIRAFKISGSSVATGASSKAATWGEAPMATPSTSI